jgi:hypothetical protein
MRTRKRHRRLLWGGGACVLTALAFANPAGAALPDSRGWELVSPVEKNGGRIDPPETIAKGGDLQAAAQGSLIAYSSASSFAGGSGAPIGSQYLGSRTSAGWATQNLTQPVFSGSYDFTDQGVPYRLFSSDLSRALMLNGDRCRTEASECPVANPPLPGTDTPAGFQDYYLREGSSFEALIGQSDIAGRGLDPSTFEVKLEGATPDLGAVVLASCSALTDDAIDGCSGGGLNLYLWKKSTANLSLLNTLPGAVLAAGAGAISNDDGQRVYAYQLEDGPLFLYEAGQPPKALPETIGGAAAFQTASTDGAIAYYTVASTLSRYSAPTEASTPIATGVKGVLGTSTDGSAVYFQDAAGLELWREGTTTTVAPGPTAADPSSWPPATGASRVSADGTKLLFPSKAKLTGYDNTDKVTAQPDTELFLYDATAPLLKCVSCRPSGARPIGPSTIRGAYANGISFAAYKPRALSTSGRRVFFDTHDALVTGDSNSDPTTHTGAPDVYQWEAKGEGSCTLAAGCLSILSNGALPQGASFADASADGSDAYFLTAASLIGTDPGSMDLYDAKVGGGFAEPQPPIPCEGDACQVLPAVPSEPSLATLAKGAGNPAVSYHKYCRKGYVKRKGICEKKGAHRRHKRHKRKGGKR